MLLMHLWPAELINSPVLGWGGEEESGVIPGTAHPLQAQHPQLVQWDEVELRIPSVGIAIMQAPDALP